MKNYTITQAYEQLEIILKDADEYFGQWKQY
jgi:hypothetical protein